MCKGPFPIDYSLRSSVDNMANEPTYNSIKQTPRIAVNVTLWCASHLIVVVCAGVCTESVYIYATVVNILLLCPGALSMNQRFQQQSMQTYCRQGNAMLFTVCGAGELVYCATLLDMDALYSIPSSIDTHQ